MRKSKFSGEKIALALWQAESGAPRQEVYWKLK